MHKFHNYYSSISISIIFIIILTIIGFWFRYIGIKDNHSFWTDEAYVSYVARDVMHGDMSLREGIELTKYQTAFSGLLLFSFSVFGPSEFSARIVTVLFGSLGILFVFFATKRLANIYGAIIASYLYTFSQLNLAHATQAKPYSIIQSLLVLEIYLLSLLPENTKKHTYLLIGIVLINIVSTLLHFIGVLNWIPFIIFILISYRKPIRQYLHQPIYLIGLLLIIAGLGIFFQVWLMIYWFIHAGKGNILFTFNHITYFRELFWRNYAFIILPAIMGFLIALRKKNVVIHIGNAIYVLTIIYLWTFKNYTHNIRYLVPLFGVIFMYFGIFWGNIIEVFFKNKKLLITSILIVILFLGGYKIDRKPATYYNPNSDLLADIQIANYKEAYKELSTKYPDIKNYFIVNDLIESQYWYLKRKPDVLFMRHETLSVPYGGESVHTLTGIPIYTSLEQFKVLMKKHPKGLLIVEDWHSFLPEEIKQYAKKKLKREIRVEGLPQAQGDNWPIEIYSWGIEYEN